MGSITQALVEGNKAAKALVKTLLTTPTLINTDTSQGKPYALPLEIETHQQSCQAEVSTNLIISKQNKVNVCDNVAPGAYTWELSGYIPSMLGVKELSNYFTPSVQMNADILRMWNKRGAILVYKDIDSRIYERVAIKSLAISIQKDCRNKIPVKLTLQELNVMEDALADMTETVAGSTPKVGSALGAAASGGTTMCEDVALDVLAAAS